MIDPLQDSLFIFDGLISPRVDAQCSVMRYALPDARDHLILETIGSKLYLHIFSFSPNIGPFVPHVRVEITFSQLKFTKKNKTLGVCGGLGIQAIMTLFHGMTRSI